MGGKSVLRIINRRASGEKFVPGFVNLKVALLMKDMPHTPNTKRCEK